MQFQICTSKDATMNSKKVFFLQDIFMILSIVVSSIMFSGVNTVFAKSPFTVPNQIGFSLRIQNGIELYATDSSYSGSGGAINANWVFVNHNDYTLTIESFTDQRIDETGQVTWTNVWKPADYGISYVLQPCDWFRYYNGYGYGTAYAVRVTAKFTNGISITSDDYPLSQPSGFVTYPLPVSINNSTISVVPSTVPANGITPLVAKVNLRDISNQPLSCREVVLDTGTQLDNISKSAKTTDASGDITFWVTSLYSGNRTLSIYDTTDSNTHLSNTPVTFIYDPVKLTATPNTIPADGYTTSRIDLSGATVSAGDISQ